MATNKKLGNTFETEFCEILGKHGYWVHNMAQKGNMFSAFMTQSMTRSSVKSRLSS